MKVYCKDCLHFIKGEKVPYPFGPPNHIKERCVSLQNFRSNHKTDSELPISTPRIINRNNSCHWYESSSPSSSSSDSFHIG